jgi:hypothetical protein
MTGSEEILAVYASGRRLHELMSLADWERAPVTFAGSPVVDEIAAGRVRYQHLEASTDKRRRLVTNLLDTHVLHEARQPGRVVAIAPAIVVETGERDADPVAPRITAVRHSLPGSADRGFERVPLSTADTLGSGLETRADHALGRLAYQLACGGVDVPASTVRRCPSPRRRSRSWPPMRTRTASSASC